MLLLMTCGWILSEAWGADGNECVGRSDASCAAAKKGGPIETTSLVQFKVKAAKRSPTGRGISSGVITESTLLAGDAGSIAQPGAKQGRGEESLQQVGSSAWDDHGLGRNSTQHTRASSNATSRGVSDMPWTLDVEEVHSLATALSPTSDKFTSHSYQTMYGTFLGPLSKSTYKPKLLEIGLGCTMNYGPGASVKVWQTLLPNADIWEADVNEECVNRSRAKGELEGVHTVTGDQSIEKVVQQWVAASGGDFDVVIDDGGHRNTQIKTSFDILWPAVKQGGLYFIEDLQVGRREGWDDTEGTMVISDIIQSWTERLLIASNPDPNVAKTADPTLLKWPLPDALEFIFCQHEACVLGKSSVVL